MNFKEILKRFWGRMTSPKDLYGEEDRKVPSPYEWDGGISRAERAHEREGEENKK
jgi:hypothetical protein